MMKRWLLGWACLIFPLGIVFAQPDEELPTILERINQHHEFTLFAQLVKMDGKWVDLLDDPDVQLTVFVPTDETLRDRLDQGDFDVDEWLAQSIVPMTLDYDVLLDHPLTYVMTLLQERGLLIQHINQRVYINTSRVDDRYYASNGVVYLLVDEALFVPEPLSQSTLSPPIKQQSLVSYLGSADDLTLFYQLLSADILKRLTYDERQLFTIFSPDNDAMQAYLDDHNLTIKQLKTDKQALRSFLERHIITGNITSETLQSAVNLLDELDFRLLTLGADVLTFEQGKKVLMVNGVLFSADGYQLQNGVLHIINGVIE